MTNTLVIAYGTSGRTLARLSSNGKFPVLLIDKNPIEGSSDPHESRFQLGKDKEQDIVELCKRMVGYTHVLFILSMAGSSFHEIHTVVMECASKVKSTVVMFCTLPFSFESERRGRAIKAFSELNSDVSTVFIFDIQKTLVGDILPENCDSSLMSTHLCAAQILGFILQLLESAPFFSYFSSPHYTMALGSGNTFMEAFSDALEHPFFETSSGCGKILVFTDMHISEQERGQAMEKLTVQGNAVPEIVSCSGFGEDKALMFIPISSHRRE